LQYPVELFEESLSVYHIDNISFLVATWKKSGAIPVPSLLQKVIYWCFCSSALQLS